MRRVSPSRVELDGVVVVLARDLDAPGRLVAHGVVRAVVAERQLAGPGADGAAEDLVAQADAEDGHRTEQRLDDRDRPDDARRVTRAVREEHAVRLAGQGVRRRGGRRDDLDGAARPDEVTQQRRLDPVVVGDDPEGRVGVTDALRGVDGHLRDEVAPVGAGRVAGRRANLRLVGAERAGQRAGVAEVPGEAARVDAGDPGDAVRVR